MGGTGGSQPGNSGCDNSPSLCTQCFVKTNSLEGKILGNTAQIANLEQAKFGEVESTLLMKSQIFSSRDDVTAWADRHFPLNLGKTIEGGCFPSLLYIFNINTADMCGKITLKNVMEDKDLNRLSVCKPDATAFFAIQSDKPDFML